MSTLPATVVLARGETTSSSSFRLAVAYALAVIAFRIILWLDWRYAAGPSRPIIWRDEVVLIIGGNGGLGRCLAQTYSMRGVTNVVADLQEVTPDLLGKFEDMGSCYRRCDIADPDSVKELHARLKEDNLCPTILINAAAIVAGQPFLTQTSNDMKRTLDINVSGIYNTMLTFLPEMLAREAGGTIINISSVLGELGCAGLSAYTTTKAALTALHTSLRAELDVLSADKSFRKLNPGVKNIRMILSRPGQLDSTMFASVKPPSQFFGPTVSTAELAVAIVRAIDRGRNDEVNMPLYARQIGWLNVLPPGLKKIARRLAGLDQAGWQAYGRSKTK